MRPELPSFEGLFRPPESLAEAFEKSPRLEEVLRSLTPATVALFSGMMTDPRWQANTARLDMLARACAVLSRGAREIDRATLTTLLNELSDECGSAWLEDPPEDPFAARVVTRQGECVLIEGLWEHATFTIETLLETAEAATEGTLKDAALSEVYALLRIANDVARGAGVTPGQLGRGDPAGDLRSPSQRDQKRLCRRVTYGAKRLAALGVDIVALNAFVTVPKQHERNLHSPPGSAAYDRTPLLRLGDDLIVLSPGSLVAAIRLRLARFARDVGVKHFQRTLITSALTRIDETGFMRLPATVPGQDVADFVVKTVLVQLEPGRWVHVIAVADSFRQGSILKPATGQKRLSQLLARSIRWAHAKAKTGDYREGLTLLMGCGWGRAMRMAPPRRLPRGWNLCAADCADFATIGNNKSGTLMDLWRLLKLEHGMRQRGYELHNVNGVLNLFGWWRGNNHQLVPEGAVHTRPGAQTFLSPGEVAKPRALAQARLGARSLALPFGGFERVLRKNKGDYFEGPARDRQYASVDAIREGVLLGVVEATAPCWVIVDNAASNAAHSWQYQVWDAVLDWSARIHEVLEAHPDGDALPTSPFVLRLKVAEAVRLGEPPVGDCPTETLSPRVDAGSASITLTFSQQWLAYLRCEDNIAERALIRAIVEGIATLSGANIDSDGVARAVMGGPDARHLRAVSAVRARDILLSNSRGGFESISSSAECIAKLGLDTLLGEVSPGKRIDGVDACVGALHTMASNLASILNAYIRTFERTSLVRKAVEAAQRASHEEMLWRRSYRAQLGLHGDTPNVRNVAYEHGLRINAIRISSRAVAEMAAAQSRPRGTLVPGRADVMELMTAASVLVHIAELANQIEAGLTPPSITFSPAGDVLANRSFEDEMQAPFGRTLSDAHVSFAARRKEPERPEPPLVLDDAFIRAVEMEYGLAPEQLFQIQATLTSACLEEDCSSIVLPRRVVESLIVRDLGASRDGAAKCVERLLLPMRANWRNPPTGFASRDIDPWRFGRRLALTARPLIQMTGDGDDLILCAPVLVEEAIELQIRRAWNGQMPGDYWSSREMKAWGGFAGHRQGLAFNEELAAELQALGLCARPNVSPSALLRSKTPPTLGDIDVIAWRPHAKTVWILEAKDLGLARTAAEVAGRLQDYAPGDSKPGKRSKLQRHLDRVDYVRQRIDQLAPFVGFAPHAVKGAVVFSSPQPMMFAASAHDDGPTMVAEDAADLILKTD